MTIAMQSMEMTEDEQYDTVMPLGGDKPTYPYGLRICLTGAELEKLGLDPAAAMEGNGGLVIGRFIGRITNANVNQDAGQEPTARVEIQIEDLGIETEGDTPVANKRGLLYAHSN